LRTQDAEIAADRIILATNGYSSEDIPSWMCARFMPVQSSIIVTRPLSDQDLINQGWTSDQMAFDTRELLHYFRLLPDKRFLFGMRGGLFSTRKEDRYIARLIRRNFGEMFAAWKDVEIDYEWYGMLEPIEVAFCRPYSRYAGCVYRIFLSWKRHFYGHLFWCFAE
jgi:glycine/D-amino acid oxidase-like deaminating enzyme